MNFIIATKDFAGLGFAMKLQWEGHEVIMATNPDPEEMSNAETRAAFERVGEGIVTRTSLADLMARREQLREHYWIWDFNHSVDENETLRAEGFRVMGGGQFANSMEHERQACMDFTSSFGLEAPPSHSFDSRADAIRFCEKNSGTAYVYKPDEGANFQTFLPESEDPHEANVELRAHLAALDSECSFILQERKDGVETNVEVWFCDGDPVFAFMGLECKRRATGDLGELVGCAMDFTFTIPLDSKAVQESVGKLAPAYKKRKYTGFADANFIAARDGVWFFEKCERFGYNAHPNLLFNLSRQPLGKVLADFIDGKFRPDFSGGFGAALTMYSRRNSGFGQAVQFPARVEQDLYFWDVYRKNDQYLIAGYDLEAAILIVNAYGYTIPTAWESVVKKAAEVKFPYRSFRTDGDRTDFPSSPIRRYEALKAMGYI